MAGFAWMAPGTTGSSLGEAALFPPACLDAVEHHAAHLTLASRRLAWASSGLSRKKPDEPGAEEAAGWPAAAATTWIAPPAVPARTPRPGWPSSFMWPITRSLLARRLISRRMARMTPRACSETKTRYSSASWPRQPDHGRSAEPMGGGKTRPGPVYHIASASRAGIPSTIGASVSLAAPRRWKGCERGAAPWSTIPACVSTRTSIARASPTGRPRTPPRQA